MGTKLGECFVGVDEISVLQLLDAFLYRRVELFALFVVELVTPGHEHRVDRHQLDDLTLGKIRGLIEDKSTVVDFGAK